MALFEHQQTFLSTITLRTSLIYLAVFLFLVAVQTCLSFFFSVANVSVATTFPLCTPTVTTDCLSADLFAPVANTSAYPPFVTRIGPFTQFNEFVDVTLTFTTNDSAAAPLDLVFTATLSLTPSNDEAAYDPPASPAETTLFVTTGPRPQSNAIFHLRPRHHFYFLSYQTVTSPLQPTVTLLPTVAFTTSNARSTSMELYWRTGYVALSTFVVFIFLFFMRATPIRRWILEQTMTLVLLIALILFDNPIEIGRAHV